MNTEIYSEIIKTLHAPVDDVIKGFKNKTMNATLQLKGNENLYAFTTPLD